MLHHVSVPIMIINAILDTNDHKDCFQKCIYIYVLFCADVIEVFFVEIIKDEKTCEKDDEQLSMDHICIDGKEEEITSSVSPVD